MKSCASAAIRSSQLPLIPSSTCEASMTIRNCDTNNAAIAPLSGQIMLLQSPLRRDSQAILLATKNINSACTWSCAGNVCWRSRETLAPVQRRWRKELRKEGDVLAAEPLVDGLDRFLRQQWSRPSVPFTTWCRRRNRGGPVKSGHLAHAVR